MKKKKMLWLVLLLVTMLVFVSACTDVEDPVDDENGEETEGTENPGEDDEGDDDSGMIEAGDEIVVALEAEPTSLDPFNSTDGVSTSVQKTMFEGLLRFDQNLDIAPYLAESYEYNEDATELRFVLREGITFHDGSEFNAEVVKANFDFVLDEDNGLARRSFFNFIDEVEVVDEFEVIIHASEPNASMASYLAHPTAGMKSLEELEKKMEDPDYNLDRNAVGTGPFQYVEWLDGQHVVVEKNDNYWDQDNMAQVESIRFTSVQEASTRVNQLRTGEVHFVDTLPTGEADSLMDEEYVNVFSGPSMNVFYIGMNMQEDKYQDENVRHAMNHAVDKDQLIAQVVDGFGRVADSPIAPPVYGYSPQDVYEYDVEGALNLMAEAGMEDGFEATLWTRNSTEFVAIAEFVAMQLEEIGIEVDVQAYESGTLFDMLDNNDGTDLWIGRWSPGTGEADWGLRPNFASDRVPPNYNNSGFYINEDVDQLLNDALENPDEEERLALYHEAQEIIYQEAPWVFLHVVDAVAAQRTEVGGIYIMQDGSVDMNGVYFINQ